MRSKFLKKREEKFPRRQRAPRFKADKGRMNKCCMCGITIPRLDPAGRPLCSMSCMNEFMAREARNPAPPTIKKKRGRKPLTEAEKRDRRVARALAKMADVKPITPERMKAMRAEIAACVDEQLIEAHKQVMGTAETPWSPVQARIFSTLMNKVLPDLRASHVTKEDVSKPLTELSREELEEMVAKAASRPDTIDAEVIPDED
jgi:hypothetical protein